MVFADRESSVRWCCRDFRQRHSSIIETGGWKCSRWHQIRLSHNGPTGRLERNRFSAGRSSLQRNFHQTMNCSLISSVAEFCIDNKIGIVPFPESSRLPCLLPLKRGSQELDISFIGPGLLSRGLFHQPAPNHEKWKPRHGGASYPQVMKSVPVQEET